MIPLLSILNMITVLSGSAKTFASGKVKEDVTIGTDLLQVANTALQLHAQETGQPMDQILSQLHDLPPLT